MHCALLIALLSLSTTCLGAPQDESRPNVLLIYADDHAEAAISAYGSKLCRTPAIDRLAREGMLFRQSFVGNSICGPSRATLLTGLHSHLHGKTTNQSRFDQSLPTFAKRYQEAGYQTAVIGKWHFGTNPQGFDHWALAQGRYYGTRYRSADGTEKGLGHATDGITERSIRWMRAAAKREEPFFLWVSHKAAHRAWEPAIRHLKRYAEDLPEPLTLFDDYTGRSPGLRATQMRISRDLFPAYDLKLPVTGEGILDDVARSMRANLTAEERALWDAAYGPENQAFLRANLQGEDLVRWKYQRYIKDYLRCVDGLDESVAQLMQALEATGEAENTIVIYTSDQGFFLGEHGFYDKRWMYEPAFKTPLIVRWPGHVQAGTQSSALVQNIDLAPTFLHVAGLDVPKTMQGESLVPVLTGKASKTTRDAVYYHYFQKDEGRINHTVARHRGVRTRTHKLIHVYEHDFFELYDLEKDPLEMHNRFGDPAYAEVRDELEKRLEELRKRYADTR